MSPKKSVKYKQNLAMDSGSFSSRVELVPSLEESGSYEQKKYTAFFTKKNRYDFNHVLRAYIPLDIVALLGGLILAWGVASLINNMFYSRPLVSADFGIIRIVEFLVISSGILLWFQHMGHYRLRMPFWIETKNIVMVLGFAMLVDAFLQFSSKQNFSRICLIAGWVIAVLLILIMRSMLRAYTRRNGHWRVATLLVGDGQTAYNTRIAIHSDTGLGYRIVAHVKDLPSEFMQAGRSWDKLCKSYGADYVIIALDGKSMANAQQPLAQLMREDIPYSISPALHNFPVSGTAPQYFMNHDVMLFGRNSNLKQPVLCFLKRSMDIVISTLTLLALSPLLLIVAALVKLDGGPAIFGHSRLGQDGKQFQCLKFRSMIMDSKAVLSQYLAEKPEAQKEWELTQKLKDDPRVTKLGNLLRRCSLDELPQLLNVLKGDMSLVGPRPIVNSEIQKYESDIAHYYRVRPGITGLWQGQRA